LKSNFPKSAKTDSEKIPKKFSSGIEERGISCLEKCFKKMYNSTTSIKVGKFHFFFILRLNTFLLNFLQLFLRILSQLKLLVFLNPIEFSEEKSCVALFLVVYGNFEAKHAQTAKKRRDSHIRRCLGIEVYYHQRVGIIKFLKSLHPTIVHT
jgi:hypothetical protein